MADRNAAPHGPVQMLRGFREGWEWGSWAISVAGTLFSAAQAVGLPDFLIEVSLFGFACYVAAIPVSLIMFSISAAVEKVTGRQVGDTVSITVLILGVLAGALFLRSEVFVHMDPAEMDTFGRVVFSLLGAAILLTPLYFLWSRYGRRSRGRGARGRRRAAPPG
ncbi:hypothetical protein [Arthrobacter sp. zg-Y1110]|uniref:hypothetical protein n=1 Tax=Arthrobacter sp. zg-Y1110 TaxID=2886932 RepID=UPI001D15CFA2|nr:hypothetical protein [Arthrobacter sp. zg-Y1110]MCC3292592.1 hypothetical protein [Arthrobacter sp. zg-Y1110]UWX86975.1 hypothetical protein N2K99_16630 [Arthrobacter sp. zg-Y1110]